ncbi:MAG: hypothetical protein C0412_18980 [Flavobacterium sp.]|nr:hypothetical protein [Flavobacterium sp.]
MVFNLRNFIFMKKFMDTFKKSVGILLISTLFILCGAFIFGNIPEVNAEETPSVCTDSDGYKNFYKKGKAYGEHMGEIKYWEDYCIGENSVYDFTCRTNVYLDSNPLEVWADSFNCPNGCQDGACIDTTTSSITVFSPNGGENFKIGSTQTITWTMLSLKGRVYIQLLKGGVYIKDITYIDYFSSADSSSQTYLWQIPTDFVVGSDYKIRVGIFSSGGNIIDESDVAFNIVTESTNLPPVISGISGPTILKTNETGTWTIKASDPKQGTLNYSVVWGDEVMSTKDVQLAPTAPVIQTTTFTHSYSKSGIYNPTFTVTDNQGLSAKTSISVNVKNENCQSICKEIGTRSEGWYDSCTGNLIKWEKCSGLENILELLEIARKKARDAKRIGDIKQIQTALEIYYNDYSFYPKEIQFGENLNGLNGEVIFKIPTNPTPGGTSYTYIRINENDYILTFSLEVGIGGDYGAKEAGFYIATPSGIKKSDEARTCTTSGDCGFVESTTCVKEGENLGAVVPGNDKQCCAGLIPYIDQGVIGTRGICRKFNVQEIQPKKPINIPYSDGSLVREKGKNKIYFVEDEKLKPITSLQIFKNYGFKIKDVILVAPEKMENYEVDTEALLPYPEGTLLKSAGKIYFVQDEMLRYISSFKIFRAHGFKVKNAIKVDQNVIDEYEEGEDLLPYPNGTLIKSAGRLYFIQDYELRYISSVKALKNLKLKRKNIIVVKPEILDNYEEGEALK